MTLPVFIGFDSKEKPAYHVFSHSIIRRASIPISIQPIKLSQLRGIYTRPRGPTESTEFSLSRFLAPYLADYKGWIVFADCDMLCLADFADLLPLIEANSDKAVLVCKHNYTPKTTTKFLGQIQTVYPRKNWSSFMVMNAAKCQKLTPKYVNSATGAELHRFNWLNDEEIGELPLGWNHLLGEYEPNPSAKVLHYTLGGPWFDDYTNCEGSDLWREELAHMLGS